MSRRESLLRIFSPFPQSTNTYILMPFRGPGTIAGAGIFQKIPGRKPEMRCDGDTGAGAGDQAGPSQEVLHGRGSSNKKETALWRSEKGHCRGKQREAMSVAWEFRKSKAKCKVERQKRRGLSSSGTCVLLELELSSLVLSGSEYLQSQGCTDQWFSTLAAY